MSDTLPLSTGESKWSCKLLHLFDAAYLISCRTTISLHIQETCDIMAIAIRLTLEKQQCMFSLRTDAWSPRVLHGYIVVTLLWIDDSWTLCKPIFDFRRFVTSHTCEATALLIYGSLEKWSLVYKNRTITTEKTSDMTSGVAALYEKLRTHCTSHASLRDFHARCLAHMVVRAVKSWLSLIHHEISSVRSLINSVKASVKRSDLFEQCLIWTRSAKGGATYSRCRHKLEFDI